MKIEYLDRNGQHEIDLSTLNNSLDILENVEQILANIGRNEASLSKLKGTQYEKRYVNDYAEYLLIKYLCDIIKDKDVKIDELVKSRVDIVTNDNSEKDEKIKELETSLKECENKFEDLHTLYEETKVELLDRDADVESLVKDVQNAKENNVELNNQLNDLKTNFEKIELNYKEELNKERKDKEVLTNELNNEKQKFNDTVVKYNEQIKKLEEDKINITKEYELLNKDYGKLTEDYTTLKNETDNATEAAKTLSNVTKEYVKVTNENLNSIREQMKQFQKTHPRLGSEMETKWFEI